MDRMTSDAAGGHDVCGGDAASYDDVPAGVGGGDGVASTVAGRAQGHVAAIRDHVAAFARLDFNRLSAGELLSLTHSVERVARSLYGVQARAAVQIDERGLAGERGARSAAHVLHEALNITVGAARARIEAAQVGLGSETITGETVVATMPGLIAAIDNGQVSSGHGRVITRCLAKIPAAVDEATREMCRTLLLDEAGRRDENGLAKVADKIMEVVTQDLAPPPPPEERAELHIGVRRGDGLTSIRGLLSPLCAEQLRVAVGALAAPKPIDEHTPDPRNAALRREQALGEILHRHLTGGAGPRDGGVRPQVAVTIDWRDLFGDTPGSNSTDNNSRPDSPDSPDGTDSTRPGGTGGTGGTDNDGDGTDGTRPDGTDSTRPDGTESGSHAPCGGRFGDFVPGVAWTDYDGPQSIRLARQLACDGEIIAQVLGADSEVLDQGRAERLFTSVQRRALVTRDKGCAFPGCDIPPAWCEAHHILWWDRDHGLTDISNGVLLCRRHHSVIHHSDWRIEPATAPAMPGTAGRPRRRPWFIPPAHIDPQREPRQNTHFHLSALLTVKRRE